MTRILGAAVLAAMVLVSCTDSPVGLETGAVILEVIVVEPASTDAPSTVDSGVTGNRLPDGWASQVAGGTADSARVLLSGPESRIVRASPGSTVSISDLEPGTYSAVLEAFHGDEVTWKGTVSDLTVVAGETTEETEVLIAPVELAFIAIGEETQLNSPSGASWTSDDAGIVDVDASGRLTAVGNGLAEVVGTLGTSTVTIAALVQQLVDSVAVTPDGSTIGEGETLQFSATAFDTAGVEVTDPVRVLWVSSDHNVATIDQSGLATGTGGGAVTISASIEGQPGSAGLAVNDAVGAAAQLAFTVQPQNTTEGEPFPTAVQVTIQDASGNAVTTATDAVTISIDNNPGSGTLSGSSTVNAVNGVATFSGLSIDAAGTGYTLAASSGSLTGATSAAFDVAAVTPTQLAFIVQPDTAVDVNTAFPSVVQVEVQDASGERVTGSNASVTLSIDTNPEDGRLIGTRTANAIDGVASFSSLQIDDVGVGYTLAATSSGLTGVTSDAFNVVVSNDTELAYLATSTSANMVVIVDVATENVVDSISLGTGTDPESMAFTHDGSTAYVANEDNGTVNVIDVRTQRVTDTIAVGSSPNAVAVTPNDSLVYVANTGSGNVSVIEVATGTVSNTIAVGSSPLKLAVTPNGSTVWVPNLASNNVSLIDVAAGTISSTIALGGSPQAIGITPNGAQAYVTTNYATTIDSVHVIDVSTGSISNTIAVGSSPQSIAFTPDGSFAYVGNNLTDNISVINVSFGFVSRVIDVSASLPSGPQSIDFTSDGSTAYVSGSDAVIVAIDRVTFGIRQILTTVPIGFTSMIRVRPVS